MKSLTSITWTIVLIFVFLQSCVEAHKTRPYRMVPGSGRKRPKKIKPVTMQVPGYTHNPNKGCVGKNELFNGYRGLLECAALCTRFEECVSFEWWFHKEPYNDNWCQLSETCTEEHLTDTHVTDYDWESEVDGHLYLKIFEDEWEYEYVYDEDFDDEEAEFDKVEL